MDKKILRVELSIPGGLHMTVFFKDADSDIVNYVKTHEGNIFEVECDALGMSNKAYALRVSHAKCFADDTECPCTNKTKHITLFTMRGGKPKDSNDITEWAKLTYPLVLRAKLTISFEPT